MTDDLPEILAELRRRVPPKRVTVTGARLSGTRLTHPVSGVLGHHKKEGVSSVFLPHKKEGPAGRLAALVAAKPPPHGRLAALIDQTAPEPKRPYWPVRMVVRIRPMEESTHGTSPL